MTKNNIKELLEIIFNNQLIQGTISIPESLINRDFKISIMKAVDSIVNDYKILFNNDFIFLTVDADIKQLGKISANYRLAITDFQFNKLSRKITLKYDEDVKSLGNMMQSMALKAASLNGTYLKTAFSFAAGKAASSSSSSLISAIEITDKTIIINLNSVEALKVIPSSLELRYLSCQGSFLKFHLL